MADKKISQLTGASTPLDGTEALPIVQSGATVKVANNDLRPKQIQSNATSGVLQISGPAAAATRVMTTPDANFTAARTDAAQSFTGVQTFNNGFVAGGPGISPAGKFTATGGNTQILLEDTTNSKLSYLFQTNDVLYYYNNAITKQIEVNADFKFYAGNYVVGTAGKGIDFTAGGGGNLTQKGGTVTVSTTATIFNASGAGIYLVMAYISSGNLAAWEADCTVVSDGSGGVGIRNATNGAFISIGVSGTDVQVSVMMGPQNIQYIYQKIG